MMKRRDFIKAGTVSVLAMKGLGAVSLAQNQSNIVVYELPAPKSEYFLKLFEQLGGIARFIKGDIKNALILIKPNISLPNKSSGGTITPVSSIEELCKALIILGAGKIVIADHTLLKTSDFDKIEHLELPKKYPQVKLVLANEERMFETIKVNGKVLAETSIMKLIPKADFFINFANAKHHTASQVSLSIKNLMGAIWNRTEFHTKMDLHQGIADLATAVKPHLNMIDTSYVLLNGGPTGPGPVQKGGELYASNDMLALDTTVALKYNFGGKSLAVKDIKHLNLSYLAGVGEIDPMKIKIEKLST